MRRACPDCQKGKMAAPIMAGRLPVCLGLRRAVLWCSSHRILHSKATLYAGQKWRIRHGFARSDTEYGPLVDLPDWSFSDGRPAPLCERQIRRNQQREELARRVVLLSTEMDQGLKNWNKKQELLKEERQQKEKSKLKSKTVPKNQAAP